SCCCMGGACAMPGFAGAPFGPPMMPTAAVTMPTQPVYYYQTPVPAMPMAAPEKLFEVLVRIGKKSFPKVVLPEGGTSVIQTIFPGKKGSEHCRLATHLGKAEGGTVPFCLHAEACRVGCGGYEVPVGFDGAQ